MKTATYRFGLAAVLVLAASNAHAGDNLLGEIDFPTSGAPDAQADFVEGVLYMHNFEYDEAQAAFQRAREKDKHFAMAYWGEAMVYNHPLWHQQSRQKALDVLRKLGRTPKARAQKAPTQREKDYLYAIETLYGTIDETKKMTKEQRDTAYMEAMRRLHETYPDDHEAAAFYGLSLLGTVQEGRDFATFMRAAAELQDVWVENPMHPGAVHYLIHAYDDPVHAPLGLPMARTYSKIAPAAAHAQHMTSHIFVSIGMWDDLVDANEKAVVVENASKAADGERPIASTHYTFWLLYGYLQQGRYAKADELMTTALARINDNPSGSERSYYGSHFARYALDTGDWDAAAKYVAPEGIEINSPNYHFALGVGAVKRGDVEAARGHLQYVQKGVGNPEAVGDEGTVGVLRKELEALILLQEGNEDAAIAMLREAVETEKNLPYNFGPPHVVMPSAELLGDAFQQLGKPEEAMAAYRDQLTRTPLRASVLLGLARAAKDQGDTDTAEEVYRQLADVWHDADDNVDGLVESRDRAQLASR